MIIDLFTPAVAKLFKELQYIGIDSFTDGCGLTNVVFVKNEDVFKISNDLFYRTTGMSMVLKCKKANKQGIVYAEFVPITDEVFYQNIIKQDVLTYFKLKEKKDHGTKDK